MITKKKLISCILAVVFTVAFSDIAMPKDEGLIYENTVRLHVLANSDSEYDQRVKLDVRDAIIESGEYLSRINDVEILSEEIVKIASQVADGSSVRAVYGKEYYDTREYDGVTFPAGTYTSMQVIIGNGQGKNWWCVLFPPLCLSAATAQQALEDTGISEDGVNVFTKTHKIKYKFRFKILEWIGALTEE